MSRRRRILLSAGLALGVAAGLLSIFRAPVLAAVARLWIIDDPPASADAIVVLGGGLETRPFAAADLYRQGWARKVLLMNVKPSPTTELGITPTEQALTRQVLLQQGVPESDLVEIGDHLASSHDEAVAVRDWVRQGGARRILIATDLFHTRRVRWLHRKSLRPTGTEVLVTAVTPAEYNRSNWWQHEEGLIDFQNELVKYLLYRWKY